MTTLQKITTDSAAIINTFIRTSTSQKAASELTDNLLQYAKGKDNFIIINEENQTIYFIDNGTGFNEKSFQRAHKLFGDPIDTSGISRYSIGSKIFGALADVREIYSINRYGQCFSSCWDITSSVDSFSDLSEESTKELSELLAEYGFDHGTVIALRQAHWGKEFRTATAFFKSIKSYFDSRYQHYLHKNKTSLTIIMKMNNGEVQEHNVSSVNIMKSSKSKLPRQHVTSDGEIIEYVSFYHPESRGISNQGIEIYYDDIKIDTIDWKRFTSRNGFTNRAKHNSLNHCRQLVFLNSVNSTNVTIDQNKASCDLPEEIYQKLASDLEKVAKYSKDIGKKRITRELSRKEGEYGFETADHTGVFVETFREAPFMEDDGKIVLNKRSVFFSKITEMKKRDRDLFISFLESLYITKGEGKTELTNFIKEFSVHFEKSLD